MFFLISIIIREQRLLVGLQPVFILLISGLFGNLLFVIFQVVGSSTLKWISYSHHPSNASVVNEHNWTVFLQNCPESISLVVSVVVCTFEVHHGGINRCHVAPLPDSCHCCSVTDGDAQVIRAFGWRRGWKLTCTWLLGQNVASIRPCGRCRGCFPCWSRVEAFDPSYRRSTALRMRNSLCFLFAFCRTSWCENHARICLDR